MTKKQLLLASKFLERYSEELGDNGCHDWGFPSDWTKKDKIEMVKEMYELNGNPEEFDPNCLRVPPDFWLVSYLAFKLKQRASMLTFR